MADLTQAWVPEAWRRRSLTRNVLMGWTSTIVGAAIAFVLTPLLVRRLDRELYGVWAFLNSLIVYANLLYLGLGASVTRGLSDAAGREDHAAQERLFGVALYVYTGLGLVCLVAAAVVSTALPVLLASPLSAENGRAAVHVALLLGAQLALAFPSSAFQALLASHGRLDLVTIIQLATGLMRTAAIVAVLALPSPLTRIGMVVAGEAVLALPLLAWASRQVAPRVVLGFAVPTRAELRSLYGFGLQAFFVQTALLAIAYTDTALIGLLLGATAVTSYVLPLQLIEYSRVLVSGVTQGLLPEVAALEARGDRAGLKTLYLRACRACAALSVFVNVHLVMLGPAFLAVWIGAEFAEGAFRILLFLSIAATAAALSTQVLTPFYQALDMLKILAALLAAEALINVGLSAWLASTIGAWGVAAATAAPAVLLTLLLAPRYVLRRLEVTGGEFARRVVLPAAAVGLVSIAAQLALSIWLEPRSYLGLTLRVGGSVLAVVPVVMATFPASEWQPFVARLRPRRHTP